MANESNIYNMSFTAGAAMLNETYAEAQALLDCNGDWDRTKGITFKENLMQKDKAASNARYFALMKQRLETQEERNCLEQKILICQDAERLTNLCEAMSQEGIHVKCRMYPC